MRIVPIAALLLAGTLTASAGFKMPSKSFPVSRVGEAMEEARKDRKAVTFIVSDTEAKEKFIVECSKEIIGQMKADSVLVYVPGHKALPESILALIEGKPVGGYIPFAIVTDAEGTTLLGIVTAESIEDNVTRAFRPIKKAVKDYQQGLSGKAAAPAP